MSETEGRERPLYKRQQYLIDSRLQFAFALPLLAIILTTALAYLAAIHVIPGEAAREAMSAAETRAVLLRANVIYYAIAAAALVCVALFVSHRIAGPAFVIERAVRAMSRGDFDERLSLRPQDYLKPLAAAVTELRNRLRLEGLERRRLVDELSARLDANDVANARQLLNDLAAGAATESPAPTTPARDARSDGFTLIELMITVGLIGLISTIAIPTFIKFQLRTKTSEVKTNLSAILVAEESFFGEYGLYVSALPPIPGAVGNAKVSWGLAATDPHGFNRMGFKVEGAGYFQYGVTSNGSTAFTAAGRSDLDGDALYNTWGYVNPERGTALGVAGPWGTCQAAGVKGPGGGGGNYVERIGPCEPNSGTSEF